MTQSSFAGFVKKSLAVTQLPRSNRQLTRDVHDAISTGDQDVLSCFALTTREGTTYPGQGIESVDFVKQLKSDGKNPGWLIHVEKFRELLSSRNSVKENAHVHVPTETVEATPDEFASSENSIDKPSSGRFDYVKLLERRIEQLESEKQQEIDRAEKEKERAERRESQLNAQLLVKDKQISAWDDLTQSLTKGLATGQLTPALSASPVQTSTSRTNKDVMQAVDVVIEEAFDKKPERTTKKSSSKKTTSKKPSKKAAPTKKKSDGKKGSRASGKKETKTNRWSIFDFFGNE